MKKILYITTLSRTINAFLVPHIEMLIDNGNKVDCACCIDKPIDNSLENRGVNVFDIPFTRNPLDMKNLKAFKKLIRIQEKNQYDIVHVHTPIASIYGRLLKLKFPKLKTIYTAHGFHFYKGASLVNWGIYYPIERIMAKFTDTIITMNEEDYKRSLKFKIKETYKMNGVGIDLKKYQVKDIDRDKVRKDLGLEKSDFVILMIAELNKNKNHIQMIKAVTQLKEKNINVKVLCAGDGVLFNNIKNEIYKNNLCENIKLLGFRNDIGKLIYACDIGMLLSYREGLPRNIMEFICCGKKVIGTNIRGIKDLISDESIGELVQLGNFEETAKVIEKFYYDEDRKANEEKIKKFEMKEVLCSLEKII